MGVAVTRLKEAIGHEELEYVALEYLLTKKDKMLEFPQVEESLQSPQLIRSLDNYKQPWWKFCTCGSSKDRPRNITRTVNLVKANSGEQSAKYIA